MSRTILRRAAGALTISVVCAAVLAGCHGSDGTTAQLGPEDISAAELQNMIEEGNSPVLLDVRTAGEFADERIPGSINIPVGELEERYQELDASEAVVCICASGTRSSQAADFLAEHGFRKVYNIEGGLNEWTGDVETGCPTCPGAMG